MQELKIKDKYIFLPWNRITSQVRVGFVTLSFPTNILKNTFENPQINFIMSTILFPEQLLLVLILHKRISCKKQRIFRYSLVRGRRKGRPKDVGYRKFVLPCIKCSIFFILWKWNSQTTIHCLPTVKDSFKKSRFINSIN